MAALAWASALVVAGVATPLIARLARRRGFTDDAGADRSRKRQAEPVPPVGGAALFAALLVARALSGAPLFTAPFGEPLAGGELLAWLALGAGFALGLVDDLRAGGLPPAAKLAGESVAGALLALAFGLGSHLGLFAFVALAAVLAQNVANTWDHADGQLALLGLCGLAPSASAASGALAGFLPWNLFARRASGAPIAYLGDSGSHLVGLLLCLSPWGWLALWPALLDLARVVRLRLAAGEAPWRGDRRHLGQRLAARGLGPVRVAFFSTLPSLPLALVLALGTRSGPVLALALAVSAALFAFLVLRSGEPRPCPDPRGSR